MGFTYSVIEAIRVLVSVFLKMLANGLPVVSLVCVLQSTARSGKNQSDEFTHEEPEHVAIQCKYFRT